MVGGGDVEEVVGGETGGGVRYGGEVEGGGGGDVGVKGFGVLGKDPDTEGMGECPCLLREVFLCPVEGDGGAEANISFSSISSSLFFRFSFFSG